VLTDTDLAGLKAATDASKNFVDIMSRSTTNKSGGSSTSKDQAGTLTSDGTRKPYDILIFVSSSMPEAELKNYSKQAHSFGATLVLRGFVQDKSSETRAFVSAMNEGGGGWMIHPEAFKLFRVDKVPAIVLADATSKTLTDDGCAQDTAYTKVSGDLTLDAALDLFSRRAEPAFASLSKKILVENKTQYQQSRLIK